MLILTVCGVPPKVAGKLDQLITFLQDTVGNVLDIGPNEVNVFFPSDLVQKGIGEELVCIVSGLFEKPKKTAECRRVLAEKININLMLFAKEHLPQCAKVETIVSRFNQDDDGFVVLYLKK